MTFSPHLVLHRLPENYNVIGDSCLWCGRHFNFQGRFRRRDDPFVITAGHTELIRNERPSRLDVPQCINLDERPLQRVPNNLAHLRSLERGSTDV